MEDDVEGQVNDTSNSSGSFVEKEFNKNVSFKEERKVKESSEINEKDIKAEPEGNNDLKKEESENSLNLTENTEINKKNIDVEPEGNNDLGKKESENSLNPTENTEIYEKDTDVKPGGDNDLKKEESEKSLNLTENTEINEKDIDVEPEDDKDLKKEESENSLNLTENNPCSDNSLETIEYHAKTENGKIGNEEVENPNSETYTAEKEHVAGDMRKVCEEYDEPNSTHKLVEESQKDILDKGCVTNDSKTSGIISETVNVEPKSPEIGFRKKSLGQFSPFPSPVKSPQMTEKSVIRSPELGGRRRLKVHIFDAELATAGVVTSRQEKSSERKDSESGIEEGSEQTPTSLGKDEMTKVRESASLLLQNAETTSPCLQEKEELPVCKRSKDSYLSVKENIDNVKKQNPSSEDICKKKENVSEKGEVSIASLDPISSAVDKVEKDSSLTEKEELIESKEYPSVEKGNSLEVSENSVKQYDEFYDAQRMKVDNGNNTDLGITEKKTLLLNECQNKSDPSNRNECQEDFTENKNSVKVVRPMDGDVVDMETKVSICEKKSDVKEVNKSGDAPAVSECMDKEFHKLNEIGKFSDENNCIEKLGKTKSVDSNNSERQCSQEGDKEFIDCPQLDANKIACEMNDSELLLDYKEKEPSMNKGEVNDPKDNLSLGERKSMLKQETDEVEKEDKDGRIDSVSGKEEEKATSDGRIQGDDKKVGIDENDQCSDKHSKGRVINKTDSFEELRTYGEEASTPCVDTGKEKLLTESNPFDSPEGSNNTQPTKTKKRSGDSDPGKFQNVSKPKRSRVSLDTQKHSDHNRKSDVETSSGTFPIDTKIECVDITNEEERKLKRQRGNVVEMVCKKCRDIWNDEVLRIIFKGTESVTVNSKITYGAIVCINNWINRNISGDKEEAITQVFERTDLGSNIAQLNISRLDEWLEELLQKGKNRCCKVFTAVYQPGKDIESHKTKAAANMPKAVQDTQSNVDTKSQNSVVSKDKRSLVTKGKGPSNTKSQSPTGIKSQSPVANTGQRPVIARMPGVPKGRVFLVPAPAVASVLPSALNSKLIPNEESTVLPKSASSLMKPCKIILKNPVRLGPKGSNQNLSNASDTSKEPAQSKLLPSGSSVGLISEENTKVVSSRFASNNNSSKMTTPVSSIHQSSLKKRNSKSTKAAVHDNTVNNREYHQHKVVSGKKSDKKGIIRKGEHERVKSPAIEVESGISSKDPAIREMLKALNLDIEDANIYSSYCSKPVTNKMKFECPSEQDETSPCYLNMLKERSALNGNALIAFDLLLYESNNHHSIASYGSTKSRFVTKRELLTLQSIFILNPETPDISLFYEVFIQILLSRKKVLLIPDSHTFLVVTENIRKEYNREKSKDLSIQILNENWDPYNIYSADDVWLEGQNPEEATNRDVISIFCTWRNLEKKPDDQSLSKALHAIWQFHNVKNGDYFGICFRMYTKFIRIVFEERDLELAKVFLDEPFSGGFCIASKKYLQNLINSNKKKISLANCDDEDFKIVIERCEELEKKAHETFTAPVLRDLSAQVVTVKEKMKEFMESHEVIDKRLTELLGKREKLLREIKGSEAKKLVQSMRAKISELHKAAQKRRQEHCGSERSIKRMKRYSDVDASDVDPSCKDVSPHMKELIKDLFSKGVKPDKVQHVVGIVSGIIKEEKTLKMPSEEWILSFAQMNS